MFRSYIHKRLLRRIFDYARTNHALRKKIENLPNFVFLPIACLYGMLCFTFAVDVRLTFRNVWMVSRNLKFSYIRRMFLFLSVIIHTYIGMIEIYIYTFRNFEKVNAFLLRNIKLKGKENIEKLVNEGENFILAPLHFVNTAYWSVILSNYGLDNVMVTVASVKAVIEQEKLYNPNYLGRSNVQIFCVDENIGTNISKMSKLIKSGAILCIAPDSNYAGEIKGISPQLFSLDFSCSIGIGVIALSILTNTPIVTATLTREGLFKYTAALQEPVLYRKGKTETLRDTLKEHSGDYFSFVEKIISKNLPQWIIFHTLEFQY